MQPVIYLDVFFALNFLMDFFLLFLVRKICVVVKPIYRVTGAAAIGAIYACAVVISEIKYNILEMLLTYLVISVLMIVTSFGFKSIKLLIKQVIMLYMITFMMCGIINAIYYRTEFGAIIDYATDITVFGMMSLPIFIVALIISASLFKLIICVVKRVVAREDDYYVVTLKNDNKSIQLRALVDTGNGLSDPISGTPVSVVNCDSILQLMKGDEKTNEKFRAIPFHSVGKRAGIMEAYRIDCMEFNKNGNTFTIRHPTIAVYRGKLSQDGEYEMLLNQKIIEGQGI